MYICIYIYYICIYNVYIHTYIHTYMHSILLNLFFNSRRQACTCWEGKAARRALRLRRERKPRRLRCCSMRQRNKSFSRVSFSWSAPLSPSASFSSLENSRTENASRDAVRCLYTEASIVERPTSSFPAAAVGSSACCSLNRCSLLTFLGCSRVASRCVSSAVRSVWMHLSGRL